MKLFRGSSGGTEAATPQAAQKLTRRSSGLGELSRVWESDNPLCVLDLGSTSATNIRFFTERSHKIYSEDLLVASTEPSLVTKDEQGNVILDSRRFLADNLVYPAAHFDVVLCWNLPDYLDESLVRPVMGQAVVRAEARRHAAGVLPHQRCRARIRPATASTSSEKMCLKCSASC